MPRKLSLEVRLKRALEKLSKSALRDPRTKEQMAARMKWERLKNIVWRRYEQKNMPQL